MQQHMQRVLARNSLLLVVKGIELIQYIYTIQPNRIYTETSFSPGSSGGGVTATIFVFAFESQHFFFLSSRHDLVFH
jgi:hypothetical protein